MKKSLPTTYAFIDSQNLNLGIRELGWKLDYQKFRIYLKEKYNVSKAYLFIGYTDYSAKKKSPRKDGTLKGKSSTGDASIVAKTSVVVNTNNGGQRGKKHGK